MYIYILELVGSRYYIGRAKDVLCQYQKHKNGELCEWTRMYPPVRIDSIHKESDIDPYVIKYMSLYGIQYVRGGSYDTVLSFSQLIYLKREIYEKDIEEHELKMESEEIEEIEEIKEIEPICCSFLYQFIPK